jgi:predicted O-methyltransferase YrrM
MNKNLLRTGKAVYHGLKVRFLLIRLFFSGDETLRKVASALLELKGLKRLTKQENEAFEKIEKIRFQYLNSDQVVEMMDYGAMDPETKLTKEEMNKGFHRKVMISEVCRKSSLPDKWGKLLFKLIRKTKPEHCLELGTCLGISAAYQLAALRLNEKGRLTSIEGAVEFVNIVKENFPLEENKNFLPLQGKFTDVLPGVLSKNISFDFVFVDGHHDKNATLQYFELLFPSFQDTSIVIFDDINWSKGMKETWNLLKNDERIKYSLDLHKWGIGIICKAGNKEIKKKNFIIPF